MNQPSPGPAVVALPTLEDRLDEICSRFEAQWSSGAEPRIEDFLQEQLSDETPEARRALLVELVISDLDFRWRRREADAARSTSATGETLGPLPGLTPRPRLADYAARFPTLGTPDTWPIQLVVHEYKIRRREGDVPDREDYVRRYPLLAGELARRFEQIDQELPATPVGRPDESPTTPAVTVTLAQFTENLRRSGLLTNAELAAWQASLSPFVTVTTAAEALVQSHKLTAYQVQRICAGQTKGLAFGEYVVLEPIGAGGMGQVFKARHRSMDWIVALKVLSPKLLDSPGAVKWF